MEIESDMEVAAESASAPVALAGRAAGDVDRRRWNYIVHAIEGGVFIGGMTFMNSNTTLPTAIKSLGGPTWLISLMPSIMALGFILPLAFTAHWIDRLHHYKPLLMVTGLLQRLPYLLAGLALFAGPALHPRLPLVAVAMAPFLSGLMGGISMTAWQALVIKTVPDNRRSSLMALRYVISCLMGVGAGHLVDVILQTHPGPTGFAWLHLMVFACLAVSYGVFTVLREPATVLAGHHTPGLVENLRLMPALVSGDRRFAMFLLSRFLRNGLFIVSPFLALHAQQALSQPPSFAGQLQVVQMLGAVGGAILAGYAGDRLGGKIISQCGLLVYILLTAWATRAASIWEFKTIFFLFGIGLYSAELGSTILSMEICPAQKRASYLALTSLVNLPGMLIASAIATPLWKSHGFAGLALPCIIYLAASIACLVPIRDPRHHKVAR